jgi:hypothetical protein
VALNTQSIVFNCGDLAACGCFFTLCHLSQLRPYCRLFGCIPSVLALYDELGCGVATSHLDQDHRAVFVRWIDSIWFIMNHSLGDHILGTRKWSQIMCLLACILQCCSCFHKCMKIPYAYSITVTVCCIIISPKLCAPVCIINRDCHNTICTVDEHLIIMNSLATSFDRYRD